MSTESAAYHFVADKSGIRLDQFVTAKLTGLSRSQVQKLIADGLVRVNGGATPKAGLKLDAGDVVEVSVPSPAPITLQPEAIPLKVIHEDDDILVVDKPAGLTVHPAAGHPGGTLVNAILGHLKESIRPGKSPGGAGEDQRPGIVHRLDKDTSGLMIVAKNSAAQQDLMDQFKSRTVLKVYITLVKGHLTPTDGIIEAPIGRDRSHRQRMAVVSEEDGRAARTRYHVMKYLDGYTLLEIKPETGRTHQIRVHLAAIGYPVVGDAVYGIKSIHLSRQFLHAARLGFKHPSGGQYLEFKSELPADLKKALEKFG